MPEKDYIIYVFCLIDDLYQDLCQQTKNRKCGYGPILLDSEIITMLIVGEILSLNDDKKIWLYFKANYLEYFPNLKNVKSKVFNKQASNLWNVYRIIHKQLLNKIGNWSLYLTDGIPIQVCHLARASRSKLFKDKVATHYCAAKDEHYHGFKLVMLTTANGIPIDYAIGAANIDERELLTDIKTPTNSTIIADKGFISEALELQLKNEQNIKLLTNKRKNMKNQLPQSLARLITYTRKKIETVFSQFVDRLRFNTTKCRSFHGFIGRINRKILAFTAALFFNFQIVKDQFLQLEHLIQE